MIIQEEHNIDFFKNQMPNKPYCTNNLDMGLSIRNKAKALEMLYLQANQPFFVLFLPVCPALLFLFLQSKLAYSLI
ncbi:hypothetical protein [Citrobacter freundii]|uniref:hypothetical protein n=1 Tax=Citrobacter freundii TaxID=546 RepID=UPI003CED3733